MSKNSTNKTRKKKRGFRSLKELDVAQKQVKLDYKNIEDNAVSTIFNPFDIATTVVPMVFRAFKSRRKKESKPIEIKEKGTLKLIKDKTTEAKFGLMSLVEKFSEKEVKAKSKFHLLSPQKNDKNSTRIIAEVLRWQLIGIGVWGVSKLLKKKK